jgi:hypothetical protein
MKGKLTFALLLFFVVSLFSVVPQAQAKPLYTNTCTGQFPNPVCINNALWGNPIHGAATKSVISAPPMHDTNSEFCEDLSVYGVGVIDDVVVGTCRVKGSSTIFPYCDGYGTPNGIQLGFYYFVRHDGTSISYCWAIPSSDYNKHWWAAIAPASGGGMYVTFQDDALDQTVCSPVSPCVDPLSNKNNYNNIIDDEEIIDTIVGPERYQWGIDWVNNQWLSTSDTWNYQGQPAPTCHGHDGHGCPYSQTSPPQMYWVGYPSANSRKVIDNVV